MSSATTKIAGPEPHRENAAFAAVDAALGVEKPSGKGAKDENFPVGSFLIDAKLRPHVATFYAFARAIDDIADDEDLPDAEKVRRLRLMDAALKGESDETGLEKAIALRRSLSSLGVTPRHGSDLIAAFIQDCEKRRYASWEELIGYCEKSANPVGRYLLDIHGEDPAFYPHSDALCTVLQITNHLQDCADDRRSLDRVYLIEPWLKEAGGGVEDLDGAHSSAAIEATKQRMLDGCQALMVSARALPASLKSRRLAMESGVIVRLAQRLIDILRVGDPIASRVALAKADFARASVGGVVAGFLSAGGRAR
ncbi:MAG: squalene synthase HpnC [Alphaproteobacteria bacterium]|nr:squalene synthase HpnC [Alphaproteobacteria bacterium]